MALCMAISRKQGRLRTMPLGIFCNLRFDRVDQQRIRPRTERTLHLSSYDIDAYNLYYVK